MVKPRMQLNTRLACPEKVKCLAASGTAVSSPFIMMAIPITTTPEMLLMNVMPVLEMSTGYWSFASSNRWSNRSTTAMALFKTTQPTACQFMAWCFMSPIYMMAPTSMATSASSIFPLTCSGSGYNLSNTKVPNGEAFRITMTSDIGALFKARMEVSNMPQYIGATILQRNKSLADPTWMYGYPKVARIKAEKASCTHTKQHSNGKSWIANLLDNINPAEETQ